ncbi:Anaerobic magnesium-protoporphyrin IX monomethyl ester cyclase [subsurface metagenome]
MNGKAEVLLISPPFKGLLREPVGLYYLAGVLNINVILTTIMDFNVEQPTRLGFRRYLKELKPKIVGVTSFTFNFSVAQDIIREIKRAEPETIIVMGGVHASALPEDVLKATPALDFIVVGEGEYAFLELCEKILNNEELGDIENIAFMWEDRAVVNPSRDVIEDLDDLTFPDRALLPFEKYPIAAVQTSRGCPYNCIFCNINRFYGKRIRLRDPRKVAEECHLLINKYRRENIFFFGDAFTFSPDWTEEFCDEILHRGLKFTWGCETRVDNVNLSLLNKIKKAGCTEIQYGIDYGDKNVLRNLGKDTSIESIEDAVRWAKDAGLFVGAFFIFNVPGEDEETMKRTFNLIQRVPVDAVEVNLLTPYPGTILWEQPDRFGMKIIEDNFDYFTTKKYVMENVNFPKANFVPAFRTLLKRLNLVPTSNNKPEIYNFLKRDIKPRTWN